MSDKQQEIFELIRTERDRQNAKYPSRHFDPDWLAILVSELGEVATECKLGGRISQEPEMIKELAQVAAVAVAWLEDILSEGGVI